MGFHLDFQPVLDVAFQFLRFMLDLVMPDGNEIGLHIFAVLAAGLTIAFQTLRRSL